MTAAARDYWRSLEELAETPDFAAIVEKEVPRFSEMLGSVDRPQFSSTDGGCHGALVVFPRAGPRPSRASCYLMSSNRSESYPVTPIFMRPRQPERVMQPAF